MQRQDRERAGRTLQDLIDRDLCARVDDEIAQELPPVSDVGLATMITHCKLEDVLSFARARDSVRRIAAERHDTDHDALSPTVPAVGEFELRCVCHCGAAQPHAVHPSLDASKIEPFEFCPVPFEHHHLGGLRA